MISIITQTLKYVRGKGEKRSVIGELARLLVKGKNYALFQVGVELLTDANICGLIKRNQPPPPQLEILTTFIAHTQEFLTSPPTRETTTVTSTRKSRQAT